MMTADTGDTYKGNQGQESKDPLYDAVGIDFLGNGGMAYNNSLIRNAEGNFEYVPIRGAKVALIGMSVFCLIFAMLSFIQLIFLETGPDRYFLPLLFSVGVPAGFSYLFYTMYLNVKQIVIFDKISGFFYKGIKKNPNELIDMNTPGYVSLSRIHALQILSCPKIRRSGEDYQINLILNDGARANISNYSFKDNALADAKKLSDELGVPVWDFSGKIEKDSADI